MDLHVSLETGRLSAGVYDQLRAAILDGRLRPGDALPPTRDFARRLDVSRNTVTNAYQRLIAEGFLVGRIGAGTFVSDDVPALRPLARRRPGASPLRPHASWADTTATVEPATAASHDFRIGVPDAKLFPWDAWRRLVARQLRTPRSRTAGGYAEPDGDPALREAIARHVGLSRAVRASADDVLVTSGAQQAFDLVARVLVERGTTVAIEEPGYPQVRRVFAAAGARIAPTPVDAEGLDVAQLPARARVVYVTPSHQFPLGVAMSLPRRLALLDWAERTGAAIVEDDYDSELRFDGRPLEPLQSLDRAGRVLYVGTFSKIMLPALRLGFVIAPPSLMPALRAARALADSCGTLATQTALAAFMADGSLARHVRRVLRTYRERRDRLVDALERELDGVMTAIPSAAGLHLASWFDDRRTDTAAVVRAALAAGVAVDSLEPFYLRRSRPGLALGYGAIPRSSIDEGIRRLATCLRRVRS
jgi:GntR family transcriptional regulator / MocR family aminotransferase